MRTKVCCLLAVVAILSNCAQNPSLRTPVESNEAAAIPEGEWEGSFSTVGVYADGSNVADAIRIRLMLVHGNARVFIFQSNNWIEAKQGKFKTLLNSPNFIVYAQDSGADQEGKWQETWALSITQRLDGALFAEWSRVVNNLDLATQNKYSTFGFSGAGVLINLRNG